jgi:hypothetical protein
MVDLVLTLSYVDSLIIGVIIPCSHRPCPVLDSVKVKLSLHLMQLSLFKTLVVLRGQFDKVLRVRHVFFVAIPDRVNFIPKLCGR